MALNCGELQNIFVQFLHSQLIEEGDSAGRSRAKEGAQALIY